MILNASPPSSSIFHVVLPHIEDTIFLYADVVASAITIIILPVSNIDDAIITPFFNASAVKLVVLVYFAKISVIPIVF